MLRTGRVQDEHKEALSPNDLKVLEESATRLIADLRAAADECVSRVEQALLEAERRTAVLEAGASAAKCEEKERLYPTESADGNIPAASPAETPAEAAKNTGLTTGEVQLIRDLQDLGCK